MQTNAMLLNLYLGNIEFKEFNSVVLNPNSGLNP